MVAEELWERSQRAVATGDFHVNSLQAFIDIINRFRRYFPVENESATFCNPRIDTVLTVDDRSSSISRWPQLSKQALDICTILQKQPHYRIRSAGRLKVEVTALWQNREWYSSDLTSIHGRQWGSGLETHSASTTIY
jgi:hypothetical protein